MSLYFSLKDSLGISCRTSLLVMNYLIFIYLGIISLLFWGDSFARCSYWLAISSFSTLNMPADCFLTSLIFNEKNTQCVFFFCCFPVFNSLTMMCLGVNLFEFILHGVQWAALVCGSMFFILFGKFLAIISSDVPSTPFSFPYRTPIMPLLIHLDGIQ